MNQLLLDEFVKMQSASVLLKVSHDNQIDYLGGSMKVSGYFSSDDKPEFGIAIGKPVKDWALIFVHESCHMDQWLESSPIWTDSMFNGKDSYTLVDEWLNGTEFSDSDILKYINCCMDVELDCEKRSLAKIIKYDLDFIDPTEYIQKSNSYILYYAIMLGARKWYSKPPYENPEIFTKMPDRFLNSIDDYHQLVKQPEIVSLYL